VVGEGIPAGMARGDSAMRGDPKQYRDNALLCTELAEKADRPEGAQVFRNLAKQWLKMAIELERAQRLRDEFEPKPRRGRTLHAD
jgi:hypothetical protein